MTMTAHRKITPAEQAVRLDPAPYDLANPKEPAPIRRRKDPRLTDQRLTAFWVYLGDLKIGRVRMVEFEDRSGWWYQPELIEGAKPGKAGRPRKPKACGDAQPMRKLAVEKVVRAHLQEERRNV